MINRIIVDFEKMDDLFCGLGQFSWHLAKQLDGHSHLAFALSPQSLQKFTFQSPCLPLKKRYRHNLFLPECRIWHAIHQDVRIFPSSRHIKKILTIHDLNFLREHAADEKSIAQYKKKMQQKINEAAAVVFISRFTQEDVLKHFSIPASVVQRVIYNGVALGQAEPVAPSLPREFPSRFLFTIGTVLEKKNFASLLEPLRRLPDDIGLIVAGSTHGDYANKMQELVKKLRLEKRVCFLGKIKEEEKIWLYDHAALFVFPSLLEGFGLPVVEAMQRGLPVLISSLTSLPEIGGEEAFYFRSFEASEMVQDIRAALEQGKETLQDRLQKRARVFSWKRAAQEYLELYEELLKT